MGELFWDYYLDDVSRDARDIVERIITPAVDMLSHDGGNALLITILAERLVAFRKDREGKLTAEEIADIRAELADLICKLRHITKQRMAPPPVAGPVSDFRRRRAGAPAGGTAT